MSGEPVPTTTTKRTSQTMAGEITARFDRHRTPQQWVGLLTRIAGQETPKIRIAMNEVTIGREAGVTFFIADESVSRQHACIVRRDDEFLLTDLGSFNGTHVDGVPVLSCVLHDGDVVQIGRTLYCFERILERIGSAEAPR